MKDLIRIMFVCHGNICRSTMAEFVMKELVHRAKLTRRFSIASAGTSREEIGHDTYVGTKEKLQAEGIPFAPREAVQLTRRDYDTYDYILAMDKENLWGIRRIVGEDTKHKVSLLMEFAGEQRGIADPWYTDDFDTAYKDILRGCECLLEKLRAKL